MASTLSAGTASGMPGSQPTPPGPAGRATANTAAAAVLTSAWRQAPWLARLWRLSPLTVLVHASEAAVDKLLDEGLLPLTARRGADRALARRRVANASAAASRPAERVLRFDASLGRDPSTRLRHRLQELLPAAALRGLPPAPTPLQLVRRAHEHSGSRLLLVMQHLDSLLAPRNDDPVPRQALCDTLVDLLSDPDLPVHLLLVVDERADVLLDTLRRRLPHIDDNRLRVGDGPQPLQPAPRPAAAEASDADFQRSLEAMLLRVASIDAPPAPLRAATPPASGSPHSTVEPIAAAVPAAPDTAAEPSRPRGRLRLAWAAAAAGSVASLVLGFMLQEPTPASQPLASGPSSTSSRPATPARQQAIAPTPTALAPPATPAAELSQALFRAGVALAWPDAEAPWLATLIPFGNPSASAASPASLSTGNQLALLRYDALQAARGLAGGPRLQVVAPMYTESLLFLVRSDSAWQSLHDLGAARINLGPAGSARALTVGTAWQALYGRGLPAAQADDAPQTLALQRLLTGQIDVLAWVGVLPTGWPERLQAGPGSGLRILPFDGTDASAARVRQKFLLAPIAGTPVPGLAVMNFLVASATADPAQLRAAARGVCSALPLLRQQGQPLWRAVQPLPALPTGWPEATAAVSELQRCTAPGVVSGVSTGRRLS